MNFKDYDEYIKFLQQNRNQKTSLFNKKLIKTKFEILGLKIPFMRNISKQIIKNNLQDLILSNKNFIYYDEVLIYGFVLALIKIDENKRVELINKFINCFDNWSVVDSFCASLKSVGKNKNLYFEYVKQCLDSGEEYKVRFAIILLMNYYLDGNNLEEIFNLVLDYQLDLYYVSMAIAWFFATGLTKNFDETLKFLIFNKAKISSDVRKKIISKCTDSFRISLENKKYIKEVLIT